MTKINTTNYYNVTTKIIDKYIQQAKQNPFHEYIFVCDNHLLLEETLLKKEPLLFSIKCINFNQFIDYCLLLNNCYKTKINTIDSYCILKQLLNKKTPSQLFNKNTSYRTCLELIELFEEFNELLELDFNENNVDNYTNKKINECFELYKQFMNSIPSHLYFNPYLELDNLNIDTHKQFIFLSNKVSNPQASNLVNKITNETTTYNEEIINITDKIQYINETTPTKEVQSVVRHIQSILDQGIKYNEINIFYPNQQYALEIEKTLHDYNIPFNQNTEIQYNPIKDIITNLLHATNHNDIIFSSSILFNSYTKYTNNINPLKADYRIKNLENNDLYIQWYNHIKNNYINKLSKAKTIHEYNSIITEYIDNHCIIHDTTPTIKNILSLNLDIEISLKQYIDFIQHQLVFQNIQTPFVEHVNLFTINQYTGILLNPKYIYIIGNTEGILPKIINDTNILLDNQRKNILHLTTSANKNIEQEINFKHIFSNNNSTIICSFSNYEISGNELIKNTLFNQLKTNAYSINIHNLPIYNTNNTRQYIDQTFIFNNEINPLIESYIKNKNQSVHIEPSKINVNNLSVSQLECYRKCPYNYLYTYLIKPHIQLPIQLQNNEIGTIIHEIIELNSKSIQDGLSINEELIDKQINDSINNNKYISFKLNNHFNKYLINKIKKDCLTILEVLKNQKTYNNYEITSLEEYVLDDTNNYSIKGFIDRIDENSKSIITIDYKAGKKDLTDELVELGFQIQLHTYAGIKSKQSNKDIAAMLYFQTKKHKAGSFKHFDPIDLNKYLINYKMTGYVNSDYIDYIDIRTETGSSSVFPIKHVKKDNSWSGKLFTNEKFNQQYEAILSKNNVINNKINNGEFDILPTKDINDKLPIYPCTYCKYKPLCRFDQFYNQNEIINLEKEEE